MPTIRNIRIGSQKKIVELALSDHTSAQEVDPMPVNGLRRAGDDPSKPANRIVGFDAAFKRSSDVLIAILALVLLTPFMLLISLLIKLDSTGPVLFYQHRRGRNQEVIKVYKFRTMYQNFSTSVPTAKSFVQTKRNDPRITRVGAILRKTSLDELPQLFNIVQGSMSLVGPRPHPIPLDEQYRHIIPALTSRYAVKPGLTGWAQVNGYRGETNRIEDMVARVEHDRHYIKNWTPWLDFKIIAFTAIGGWTHRNAY